MMRRGTKLYRRFEVAVAVYSILRYFRCLALVVLLLGTTILVFPAQQSTEPPCEGSRWICSEAQTCLYDCRLGEMAKTEVRCSQVSVGGKPYCCLYLLHIYRCKCSFGQGCGNAGISIVFWWGEGQCSGSSCVHPKPVEGTGGQQ